MGLQSAEQKLCFDQWKAIDTNQRLECKLIHTDRKSSSYERKVSNDLKQLEIPFYNEVIIRGCTNSTGTSHLSYDFLVFHLLGPIFIEVDGEQHFQHVPKFHGSKEYQQHLDRIKNNFTKNRVYFLRISYSMVGCFPTIFTDFIRKIESQPDKIIQHFTGKEYQLITPTEDVEDDFVMVNKPLIVERVQKEGALTVIGSLFLLFKALTR